MTTIAFSNLRAEMARNSLSITAMADEIKMKRSTLSKKLKHDSPLFLSEAYLINKTFFPDKDLPYLFSEVFKDLKT